MGRIMGNEEEKCRKLREDAIRRMISLICCVDMLFLCCMICSLLTWGIFQNAQIDTQNLSFNALHESFRVSYSRSNA